MPQTIAKIGKNFLNLIYPLHCAACGKALDSLNELGACDFCIGEIRANPRPHCPSCGRSLDERRALCPECQKARFYFCGAHSACLYEGVMKELIHAFKYRGRLSLSRLLSMILVDFVEDDRAILNDIDMITFVALEPRRLRERSFNQSKILASHLSSRSGLALADTLEKALKTSHQSELSRAERLMNLNGAFRVRRGSMTAVRGLNILLVDDVMTTGATLNECSRALLDAGAKSVRCLTLARGL